MNPVVIIIYSLIAAVSIGVVIGQLVLIVSALTRIASQLGGVQLELLRIHTELNLARPRPPVICEQNEPCSWPSGRPVLVPKKDGES